MAKKGQQVVIQAIPLNKIKLSRNSRTSISQEELDGLMQSIKEVGLLQAIGVVKKGTGYEICYGNRRFLACSKLGMTKIPAFVHDNKREVEIDVKNLTENIQRRNLSLSEVGRYIELLKKDGLTTAECAVRLGVNRGYVEACIRAYNEVPEKFKDDLELSITKGANETKAKKAGKISVTSAKHIINASKAYGLSETQKEKLFEMAKKDERFLPENSRKYAAALKSGVKDPISAVKPLQHVMVQFWTTKEHLEELRKKHVDEGAFRSLNGFFVAVLKGEKSARIQVVDVKKE